MGWRAKVGGSLAPFQGKNVTGQNVRQGKKRTKAGRDVSVNEETVPLDTRHIPISSGLIGSITAVSLLLTSSFTHHYSHPPHWRDISRETHTCYKRSLLCVYLHSAQDPGVPGWCRPTSSPSSLVPSSLSSSFSFPTHPSGALQRQDRNTDRISFYAFHQVWIRSVKYKTILEIYWLRCWNNAERECVSSSPQHLVQLLSPAARTRFSGPCFPRSLPSTPGHSNQAREIHLDLWG